MRTARGAAVPRDPERLAEDAGHLQFPVVVKLPAANNCIGRRFCDNLPELQSRYAELHQRETGRGAAPPFVQQKIDG